MELKYAGVRNTIWNKGFKNGQIDDSSMSQETFAWLDKAIEAHYRRCIYSILDQVGTHHHDEVLKSWKALLVDMYGNDQTLKNGLYDAAMEDSKVSQAAKNWLKKVTK